MRKNHFPNDGVKENINSGFNYSESIKILTFCFILCGPIKNYRKTILS